MVDVPPLVPADEVKNREYNQFTSINEAPKVCCDVLQKQSSKKSPKSPKKIEVACATLDMGSLTRGKLSNDGAYSRHGQESCSSPVARNLDSIPEYDDECGTIAVKSGKKRPQFDQKTPKNAVFKCPPKKTNTRSSYRDIRSFLVKLDKKMSSSEESGADFGGDLKKEDMSTPNLKEITEGSVPPSGYQTPREKRWVARAMRQKARKERESKNCFKTNKNKEPQKKSPVKSRSPIKPSQLRLVTYSSSSEDCTPEKDKNEKMDCTPITVETQPPVLTPFDPNEERNLDVGNVVFEEKEVPTPQEKKTPKTCVIV